MWLAPRQSWRAAPIASSPIREPGVAHDALGHPRFVEPVGLYCGWRDGLAWFRDEFFNARKGMAVEPEADSYDELTRLAGSIPPGSDGLFFSPHLGGRICPAAPEMRGAWLGFSWGHTQAHFARSVLESVAYEYAYYLSILQTLIPDLELSEARVVGRGARSTVWNQIKADVLGLPYPPLQGSEFGSWGSAMIAGKAAEIIDDLPSFSRRTCSASRRSTRTRPASPTHFICRWFPGISNGRKSCTRRIKHWDKRAAW